MGKHLLLAVTPTAFGEAVLGVRLASELRAAGHEVSMMAPAALRPIADEAGIRFGAIDDALPTLDRALSATVREQRFDSLVLIDAASVFQGFEILRLDPAVFFGLGAPVLALDIWNLDESGVSWDFAGEHRSMDARVLALPRLVPVPFARPAVANGYNALPARASAIDRDTIRAQLGLAAGDRLIFWPTASWQLPRHQPSAAARYLADAVPELLVRYVATLGDRVRVLHVGLEPMRAGAALAGRYRWLPQLPAARFAALLAASDLVLGANVAATTLASAVCLEVPALVAINSHVEASAEAIASTRGALGPLARAWIEQVPGLYRFRVWPAGLYDVLAPVLRDNPLAEAVRFVELLDEPGVLGALHSLLFDDGAAAASRAHQRSYRAEVERLPSASARFAKLLAEHA